MAKRFTNTDKYRKAFFRSLPGPYKLLWDLLYHECNRAGIWIKDFLLAQVLLGQDMPVNEGEALKYFNAGELRVIEIDNKKKWFIPQFVTFQYGKQLTPASPPHVKVIELLKENGLINDLLQIITPLKKSLPLSKGKGVGNPYPSARVEYKEEEEEVKKGIAKGKKNYFIRPGPDYPLELSAVDVSNCMEVAKILAQKQFSPDEIQARFTAFKIQFFTGDKDYKSEHEILRHFQNTLKFAKNEELITSVKQSKQTFASKLREQHAADIARISNQG